MTSSTSAGDCRRTPRLHGTTPWSTAVGVWYPGAPPEAASEEDCPPPAGGGSGWTKWAGPAPWSTGWRWTVCTCCGWGAATRRAMGSTARRCTCTPRRHQVRPHTQLFDCLNRKLKRHHLFCGVKTNTCWVIRPVNAKLFCRTEAESRRVERILADYIFWRLNHLLIAKTNRRQLTTHNNFEDNPVVRIKVYSSYN